MVALAVSDMNNKENNGKITLSLCSRKLGKFRLCGS